MIIAINVTNDRPKVTPKLPVAVVPPPPPSFSKNGIKPIKLHINMNIKKVAARGVYLLASFLPILGITISFLINSTSNSYKCAIPLGFAYLFFL